MRPAETWCAALVLMISGCGPLEREVPWKSVDLGTASLEIRYLPILGAAAFAPQRVVFYSRGKDGERWLAETTLRNDGANLGDHNLEDREQGDGRCRLIMPRDSGHPDRSRKAPSGW